MQSTVIKNKRQSKRIPELEQIYGKPVTEIIKEYYLDKQYGIRKTSRELLLSIRQIYMLLEQAGIEPRHEKQPNKVQIQRMSESIKRKFAEDPTYKQKLSEARIKYYENNTEAKEKSKDILRENRNKNIERLKTDIEYRNKQLLGILEDAKKRTKIHGGELYDLYWNQNLDMKQIAEKLCVHWSSVQKAIKRYGIPIRTREEIQRIVAQKPEHIVKLSERAKRYWRNPEYHKLKIEQATGENNPFYGKTHTEETKEKILKAVCSSPNKLESYIDSILQKNFPNTFRYVGDASITIHGLSVDFISNDLTKVIEVFGDDWHSEENSFGMKIPYVRTEEGRKHVLQKYGYDCLILWQSEIQKLTEEQIVSKIKEFLNTPSVST